MSDLTQETPRTGWAAESRLPELDERLAKAAKQAAKIGVTGIGYRRTGREQDRTVKTTRMADGREIKHVAKFVEIEIVGEIPKLPGGWKLVAVINHEEGAPIVNSVPGETMPAGQRERGTICDHCRTRRERRDTFVLVAEDERVVQIGRNCIADFLGMSIFKPEVLLHLVAFLRSALAGLDEDRDEEEGAYSGGTWNRLIEVLPVVEFSAAAIDAFGWVSRGRSNASNGAERATSDDVGLMVWPPPMRRDDDWTPRRIAAIKERLGPKNTEEAEAALAWARGLAGSSDDYLANLAVLASRGTVGADKFGLLVSLIAAYRREMERLRERERKAKSAAYIGTIGKREVFELTVVKRQAFEGDYGPRYRIEFAAPGGEMVIWWASNDPTSGPGAWEIGQTVKVKATVKKHDEWKGIKQTVVQRVAEVTK